MGQQKSIVLDKQWTFRITFREEFLDFGHNPEHIHCDPSGLS